MFEVDTEKLETIQRKHLDFLETAGKQSPKISGVPIMLPFTYDLIQIFNNLYLEETLNKLALEEESDIANNE